jgi:cbb3-type cytochrome oxidase subunit 3
MKHYLNKIIEPIKRLLLLIQVIVVHISLFLVYIFGFGLFFLFSFLSTKKKRKEYEERSSFWRSLPDAEQDKKDLLRQS